MDNGNVTSTDIETQKKSNVTSELNSIPLSAKQEVLPINKNKPWRLVIRRIVSDGRSRDKNVL